MIDCAALSLWYHLTKKYDCFQFIWGLEFADEAEHKGTGKAWGGEPHGLVPSRWKLRLFPNGSNRLLIQLRPSVNHSKPWPSNSQPLFNIAPDKWSPRQTKWQRGSFKNEHKNQPDRFHLTQKKRAAMKAPRGRCSVCPGRPVQAAWSWGDPAGLLVGFHCSWLLPDWWMHNTARLERKI